MEFYSSLFYWKSDCLKWPSLFMSKFKHHASFYVKKVRYMKINMTMEMADRTKSIPKGIVENLLVKIENFIFLLDFVILDMVKDFWMPIILRRPLLATIHAKVDVFGKVISLEVVYVHESQEEIDYRWSMLDQGEPWEIEIVEESSRKRDIDLSSVVKPKVHWCMAVLQQKGDGHEFWASCDLYDNQCDRGDLPDNTGKKYY
ncbi:hypothetical protein Tco_0574184 [Tanacetum coccineum]